MNERPAPSPPDTPPPSPLQAGRSRPAHRVPLVLLCQETGISPPHPLHSTTRTPPPLSSHRPSPVPGRRGTGRGTRDSTAVPWRAPTSPCAPGPRPRPQRRRRVALPGGVHAAAAPRSLRSGSCRRTCPLGRGEADNGAAVKGSGTETLGPLVNLAEGTPVRGSFPGEPVSLAGQWDLRGPRAASLSREPWAEGGASEDQTRKLRLLLRGNGVGSSGARSGSRLGMTPRPDLEAKPPGEELCNTPFQSLAF